MGTRKLILIGCSTIAQLLEIEKNKKQDKMFQSFVNLKGSFVNDEYVVKKFEHVHRDKENECFQKSRKLLSVLVDDCDGEQSKGFCICDRLPCLVVCGLCGASGHGRVAKVCTVHPYKSTEIGTDLQKCPVCHYAKFLVECVGCNN